MKNKMALLIILSSMFNISQAHFTFESTLKIDKAIYSGTGCPKESVTIDNINDQIININFNNFSIETNRFSSKIVRKNCSIAIPFELESGKRLIIKSLALTGETDFNRKNTVDVNSEIFLDTERSIKISETLSGSGDKDSLNLLENSSTIVSECGESGLLRLNTSLLLKIKKSESALIRLGGADTSTGILTEISVEPCQM